MLKRELIFVGVAAVLIAGYLFAGLKLAPDVPPEPESHSGSAISLEQFIVQQDALKKRDAAIVKHNEFLETWRQWGAGIGVVLIVFYTLWRPPWYVRATREAPSKTPSSAKERKPPASPERRPFNSRISRRAMLMMTATIILLIVAAVLLAWVLGQ